MKKSPLINIILLMITLLTTLFAGYWQENCSGFKELLNNPFLLYKGIPFSLTLILILGAHELGHYLMAKKRGINATLPFFIPSPHPLVGTFGAFIKIKGPIPNRKSLLDIAVAGPLSGFLVALPAMIIGIRLSEAQFPAVANEAASLCEVTMGSSLLISFLIKNLVEPLPSSYLISMHPIAFAAWIGFFVTALNLLPIGQLDGGHIIYALFPGRHRTINKISLFLLVPLGLFWQGWFLWALVIIIFGFKHPSLMEEHSPLDKKRKMLGILALAIFFITFVPVPFMI